jgi:hypothetical protein
LEERANHGSAWRRDDSERAGFLDVNAFPARCVSCTIVRNILGGGPREAPLALRLR